MTTCSGSGGSNELIKVALDKPMVCEPGTCFAYSHANFVILGEVMRKVTGEPVEALIAARILKPLGLTNTRSEHTAIIQEPVLHAFTPERKIYEDFDLLEPVLDTRARRGDDDRHFGCADIDRGDRGGASRLGRLASPP